MGIACYLLAFLLPLSVHRTCHAASQKETAFPLEQIIQVGEVKKMDDSQATTGTVSPNFHRVFFGYEKRRDFDTNNFNVGIGKRLRVIKEMVKKMGLHRSRRNILGILKDSVHSNLSNLLQHALDEVPPENYRFPTSIWRYPPDSTIWRHRKNNYFIGHNSHKEESTRSQKIDPMMQWMGIGR